MKKILVLILVIGLSGCAPKNIVLTPVAQQAYTLDQVVNGVGTLQLAAENATITYDTNGLPLLSVNTARLVVAFCVAANQALGSTGLVAGVKTAYTTLKGQFTSAELIKFGAALTIFEVVLNGFVGA